MNFEAKFLSLAVSQDGDCNELSRSALAKNVGKQFSFTDIVVDSVERDDDVVFEKSGPFGDGMIAVLADVLHSKSQLIALESAVLSFGIRERLEKKSSQGDAAQIPARRAPGKITGPPPVLGQWEL